VVNITHKTTKIQRTQRETFSLVKKMQINRETVAVVTGAANGIGRALALRLSKEGARLALADIDEEKLQDLSVILGGAGVHHSIHKLDVSNSEDMEDFARQVISRHGSANLLINNAGVALHGFIEEVSLTDIEWLMGINFWGTVYGVKHFLPILKEQKEAHIVNLSSVFGLIAPPGQAAYCASKFAVRGFTEALKHELAGTNVTVSSVHPGGIRTEIAVHARLGQKADPALKKDAEDRFSRLARTPPEAAAERILQGIARRENRILIGRDARMIDILQRLIPVRYWQIMGRLVQVHPERNGKK
jgi:NAD(P)-dependent dehydrogenase (short-subunit alcohol dehydrogenase family)